MSARDISGRFIPTFDPADVVGPDFGKSVTPTEVLQKYSFGINESTCVATVDYDPEAEEMTIVFQKRGSYKYFNVPFQDFIDFQLAGSRGTYFNQYIRDQFSYERI